MGEGDPELLHWHDDEQSEPETTELVARFSQTWHIIADTPERWTSVDLEHVFPPPAIGSEEESPQTRQWIVWHVLEHEIHHGGELSLALGTYGLESFYTW